MNVSLLLLWNFPAKPSHDLQGPWPKQGQYIIMVQSVNVTVYQLHIMEMQSPFTFLKRESFHTVCDIRGNWQSDQISARQHETTLEIKSGCYAAALTESEIKTLVDLDL